MDPKDIGKVKPPAQMDAEDDFLKDLDQRWNSQIQDAQEAGKLSDGAWDGEGYLLGEVRRIAAEHPETRRHLIPLLKKLAAGANLFVLKDDMEVIFDPFTHRIQIGMGGEWWNATVKLGKNVIHHRKERVDDAYRPVTVYIEAVGHALRFAIGGGFGMGTMVMMSLR